MTISRRLFLKNTIAGAAFVSSGIELPVWCHDNDNVHGNATVKPSSARLDTAPIRGRVVTAHDAQFDDARRDYNGRFDVKPNCILFCESEKDVCEAVQWARKNQLPVSIRSGGHNYEGFSLIDGGAVIDVSRMNNISVNTTQKTATVESGAKIMPLYETLWEKRCVVPAGSCGTVGVGGLTLGGGFGLLARHMGLTCDNLLQLKLVDAHGKIIEANAEKNTDLLWACKGGGGGNFGIITEFTYRTHPIGNVCVFRIRWDWKYMPNVIRVWQNWAPFVDDRITSILTLTSEAADSLSCIGIFLGGEAKARALIEPLLSQTNPTKVTLSTTPFIDAARRFSGFGKHAPAHKVQPPPETVHPQLPPHPVLHTRFKNTSDYVREKLDEKAIQTIVTYLTESPSASSCVQFDSYGGAINRVPENSTAFCHRGDTKFCMHYQNSWRHPADDEKNTRWVNEFRKAMKPYVSGFNYVNYCDREIENWGHSYYGENLERLTAVKKKYDPDDFFRFAQSIPSK